MSSQSGAVAGIEDGYQTYEFTHISELMLIIGPFTVDITITWRKHMWQVCDVSFELRVNIYSFKTLIKQKSQLRNTSTCSRQKR